MNQHPLPHWGEFHPSKQKKHKELVVLIHNYGSRGRHLRRYAAWMNELGFDAVTFDLSQQAEGLMKVLPFDRQGRYGLRHIWADEISDILNAFKQDKIIFSLSFPSVSALEAMYRRNFKDIKAWICDGGPFMQMLQCGYNLFAKHFKLPAYKRLAYTIVGGFALGYAGYDNDRKLFLQKFPANVPILSVRAWQDRLVPKRAIEGFFQGFDDLDLHVLNLPEADHLQGLHHCPNDYKPRIEQFLNRQIRR